jgi:formiminotetrahydrofolate cyclodeaminase
VLLRWTMNDNRIGAMSLEGLLATLGSDAPTPGSGAAGALALALAAACASKALAITAKHRALSADLVDAGRSIAHLLEAAVDGADADAIHFKKYLQQRSSATAEELRQTDHCLLDLCVALGELIDRVSADIHPIVAGDIAAARALVTAAAAIHRRNEATI